MITSIFPPSLIFGGDRHMIPFFFNLFIEIPIPTVIANGIEG